MRRRAILIVVLVAALIAAGAVVLRVQDAAGDQATDAPKSTFSVSEARSFTDFPLYDAGPTAIGLPRVAVLRRDEGAANYVSFVYGDCAATSAAGCAPPAEVQIWPSCARNLSLYGQPDGPRGDLTSVRGAPAAFFEEGRRLELQTGRSTIVIFGRTRDQVVALAGLLRGVNVAVQAGSRLPPPADGSVAERLDCRP
jgi:hypothetical protein